MSNSGSVWRTAPIPIAPKPPGYNSQNSSNVTGVVGSGVATGATVPSSSLSVAAAVDVASTTSSSLPGNRHQVGLSTIDLCMGSMPGRHFLESHRHTPTQPSLLSTSFASKDYLRPSPPPPPCSACRQSRSQCTLSSDDEDSACVSCKINGCECSLALSSPQLRKRKLAKPRDSGDGNISGKRSSPSSRRRHPHKTSTSLSSTAGSNSFLEDMENVGGPIQLKRTLGMQEDRYSQYIGPTTDFEPSLINLSPFNPDDESLLARGTLRKVSDSDTFLMLPDSATPSHEHQIDDCDAIERVVAPYGPDLVAIFFDVVHPGFPILQKTVFMERYERSYREFTPPLLAAVYLIAINWWGHSDKLAQVPRPDVVALEKLMRSTLADAMFRPKLSVIQAGLLLSQRPEGDQWAPTAQLVAVSQELGLHLDCSNWKIPPWEKGLRKRLAWALYMQDKWGALVHGRPSHIFSTNWAVRQLCDYDFPDVEWDEEDVEERARIEQGRVLFVNMVHLTQILSQILDTFYTLHAMQASPAISMQETQAILAQAKPIQLKLKDWYATLPQTIRMDSTYYSNPSSPSRFSSIGYLHLAYFATEITLHRRIIRSFSANPDATDPYVSQICRSAAKARLISAMDFVNRLMPQHLRSFWYFASKTNFALIGTFGSLLWATASAQEEADWYRRRLGEYRWTLSVSSKPGEGKGLTQFAMGMLDISTGLLKKLPEKPPMSRSGSVVEMPSASFAAPVGFATVSSSSFGQHGQHDGLDDMDRLDASGVVSPRSMSDDSSDDEMDYDGYQPSGHMESIEE
ncbi:Transcriptional activator protein DAL81 [Ceratocystis fimbriata CBS 114723]|uniref:Transcriptional activator protein DAL81 n=1 Tax=Ceratocystis fimbriata CBS 114723 TaxID=1035309 RepID=A0A2C5X0T3_9PEZI|nr:Transcriptional activator protein DAL81 [Ceratocystis fimbriata CBS 114723]